jgi:hypothetical protein
VLGAIRPGLSAIAIGGYNGLPDVYRPGLAVHAENDKTGPIAPIDQGAISDGEYSHFFRFLPALGRR